MKSFSIVGIGGAFRVVVYSKDGNTYRRHFNTLSHCFKWLKGFDKHTRLAG